MIKQARKAEITRGGRDREQGRSASRWSLADDTRRVGPCYLTGGKGREGKVGFRAEF